MSDFILPMLATDARQGMADPKYASWVSQEKVDGIRTQLHSQDGHVTLFDRQGRDMTTRFPEITEVAVPDGIYDGEIMATSGNFHDVLRRYATSRPLRAIPCRFLAFDLLAHEGRPTWQEPLLDRLWRLESALEGVRDPVGTVVTSSEVGGAEDLWHAVLGWGGEGLILKNPRSAYQPGRRTSSWLKFKARWSLTVALTTPSRVHDGLSVRMELYGPDGPLSVGSVGTGWSAAQAQRIVQALHAGRPLKAEVVCLGRDSQGILRSPVFQHLARSNAPASDIQLLGVPQH